MKKTYEKDQKLKVKTGGGIYSEDGKNRQQLTVSSFSCKYFFSTPHAMKIISASFNIFLNFVKSDLEEKSISFCFVA